MNDFSIKVRVYCEECDKFADFQVKKIEQEIEGYYDDEDGNLQMTLKEVVTVVDVCTGHLEMYLNKSYEMVGTYNKMGM